MSKPLNRRAFLTTGALATVVVAVGGARPAGAVDELPVYRLSADWGYPVGPKGKTRCSCRACFRRADNAYFRTKAAALEGRIHRCCVCQPYATAVPGVSSQDLFLEGDVADRRDPRVASVFQAMTVPAAEPVGAMATLLGSDPNEPDAAPAAASGFARTGGTLGLARIGAGVASVGVALLAFRSRSASPASVHVTSRPPNKEPS